MPWESLRTNFPDQAYLRRLIRHAKEKVERNSTPLERLRMYSGAAMNWVAEYVLDPSVRWKKVWLPVDRLTLTGTWPAWNRIILDRAKRSPRKLRELIETDRRVRALLASARFTNEPILVRQEAGKWKVLDGMHRVVAAIRSGRPRIQAFVASWRGRPRPPIEPHVVYDLLKAYHRGLNRDRRSLIIALRYFCRAYPNVESLLRKRFGKGWTPSDEMQRVIKDAMKKT